MPHRLRQGQGLCRCWLGLAAAAATQRSAPQHLQSQGVPVCPCRARRAAVRQSSDNSGYGIYTRVRRPMTGHKGKRPRRPRAVLCAVAGAGGWVAGAGGRGALESVISSQCDVRPTGKAACLNLQERHG